MNKKEYAQEAARIAAIIGDNIAKPLYKLVEEYIPTVELISEWSIEFLEKHKKTDWEEVLFEDTLKPLSKKTGFIACWDDAVIDFAHFKLEEYKKRHY